MVILLISCDVSETLASDHLWSLAQALLINCRQMCLSVLTPALSVTPLPIISPPNNNLFPDPSPRSLTTETSYACSQLQVHYKNIHRQTSVHLCIAPCWPLLPLPSLNSILVLTVAYSSPFVHHLIYCVSITGIFNLIRKGPVWLQAFITAQ